MVVKFCEWIDPIKGECLYSHISYQGKKGFQEYFFFCKKFSIHTKVNTVLAHMGGSMCWLIFIRLSAVTLRGQQKKSYNFMEI